jgi:hypothetical protein
MRVEIRDYIYYYYYYYYYYWIDNNGLRTDVNKGMIMHNMEDVGPLTAWEICVGKKIINLNMNNINSNNNNNNNNYQSINASCVAESM